ncbi:hypothetical protein E3Q22_02251 [Wallemia mellicola]|uniref:Small nuclear ribonucleoprotein Sm D3 n=1 Tax=Wallemia mellicola TaxID=1708541 RepID=A0A4T0MAB1_9BASI|nr:hypothetical protein E3Q22_02251 [Wallemia mellicola]TIC02764.1 hypothetical protein E3Q17_01266 [Wallemia mellicola]TIC13419.1 hypothetical protein E3Q14_01298 [Wallemia mellicola]TIC67962.1 hypothetical protein E3Q01_01092 [Wallemia mellicola]
MSSVPIKLVHECKLLIIIKCLSNYLLALGHVVTIELKSGQMYRGKLQEAEDNLNVSLQDITVTARDGRVSQLDQVYIRGSMIKFLVVPDMLQNAPMWVYIIVHTPPTHSFRFKRVGPNAMKGRGIGTARGRATIMRANARRGRGGPPTVGIRR